MAATAICALRFPAPASCAVPERLPLRANAATARTCGVEHGQGERLLKYAVDKGYDEVAGGVFTKMDPDGTLDRDKYFWQQSEAVRAFLAAPSAGRQNAK